jgi:methionine sulfoxide reductase catalytic subunit
MPTEILTITPLRAYLSRREFLRRCGILAVGGLAVAACADAKIGGTPMPPPVPVPPPGAGATAGADAVSSSATDEAGPAFAVDELGNPTTTLAFIQRYGYYYEFSRERMTMGAHVGDYRPPAARIEVGGLVRAPLTFDMADLSAFEPVLRVYRHRCLECWAMVIPWQGVPLRRVIDAVRPLPEARFVRFESLLDPQHLPGQQPGAYAVPPGAAPGGSMGGTLSAPYRWPYVEGLRLDEARHDLTLLAVGMYGQSLPPCNGGPVRLVVPWKYGFKSIKNVRRIDFVAAMPDTFWRSVNPAEHGFYANVNPNVPHPRWGQTKEARYRGICPERIVPTIMFNGYEAVVADLYRGMDLSRDF